MVYTSVYCLPAVCDLHLSTPAICGLLLCLPAVHVVYTYVYLQTDTLRSKGGLSGLDYCGLQDGAYPHCLTKAGGPEHPDSRTSTIYLDAQYILIVGLVLFRITGEAVPRR